MQNVSFLDKIKKLIDDMLVFMGQMICFVILNIIIILIVCFIKKDAGWLHDPEQTNPFFYFFVIGSLLIMNLDKIDIIIKKIRGWKNG